MRALLGVLPSLALALVFTGCVARVETYLRVTNLTGTVIQFYTGHTKQVVRIPSGATVSIPHTEGTVIIITENDAVWQYASLSVLDFPNDTTKSYKRVTLPVTLQPDAAILLPSGKKIAPTQKLAPKA